jgi:hypothetical protein
VRHTEHAVKLAWWNKSISCGPVVEQATHFIDLVRFIAGKDNDVVESSIQATSVEHDEEVGSLSKIGFDESAIEAVNRIPRVTSAFWKHKRVSKKSCPILRRCVLIPCLHQYRVRLALSAMPSLCMVSRPSSALAPLQTYLSSCCLCPDQAYDTELEVLADGWVIKLKDAYSKQPTLSVRGANSAKEGECQWTQFGFF